jgi:penicillin-binding protein 1C
MIRRSTRPGFAPALILALSLWAGAIGLDRARSWVAETTLPPLLIEISAEVLDRNGQLLRAYTVADGRWRMNVDLGDVDPLYIDMLLAYEDKRFFDHAGVDPRAMARAALQSLTAGRIVAGGSTLTMQVARLLENSGTGRWRGKIRQTRVALALEQRLTKDQILTLYLKLAPMGGNLEGIRAASLSYFGKDPKRLTPAQAAMLVAIPQSPEGRRPDRHPLRAQAARDRVIARMQSAGLLDQDTAQAALTDSAPRRRRAFPALAPHMTDRALAAQPDRGRVQTTLDGRLQASLEDLARKTLTGRSDRLSIAILVADHQSGQILASIGSAGLSDRGQSQTRQGHVDMSRALRSPGSTLKPLIYGLAFDAGLAHPETLINDRPMDFDGYAPQNFDGVFRGELRVADALRLSLNLPAVQLTQEIGPQNLVAALTRAGLAPEIPGDKPGLAVALGGLGLRLEGLTQLYSGLANQGIAKPLTWLVDDTPPDPTPKRILSRAAAWQVASILSDIAPPDGARAQNLAYKTGTSYGHRDAWAIGFDGQHVIGIWLGRPDGTAVPGAFGGQLAAPVLFEAFDRLKPQIQPLGPPPPETLIISAAQLPEPLKRFRPRNAYAAATDAPNLIFPPDGAQLSQTSHLPAKVSQGHPPFTWLANGTPLTTRSRERNVVLPLVGRGFTDLTVIDAKGRSASARIRID